jgi:hypothetical protein
MIELQKWRYSLFIDQFKYNISGKTMSWKMIGFILILIYIILKFPQWEIGLGVLAPKLYIAFPNIFCFLVVFREHNSAPKWSMQLN